LTFRVTIGGLLACVFAISFKQSSITWDIALLIGYSADSILDTVIQRFGKLADANVKRMTQLLSTSQ
jgi:hypothetical protein